MDRKQLRILKHAVSHEERNYYATAPNCDSWNDVQTLVAEGFMRKGRTLIAAAGGLTYFHVTDKGREILRANTNGP